MAEAKKDESLDLDDDLTDAALDLDSDAPEIDLMDEGDALDKMRAERDEMRDRFMRALADAENARKRGERDRREAEKYGGSKLAKDMLPVFDNLHRALEAVPEESRESNKALIAHLTLITASSRAAGNGASGAKR